MWFEVQIERNKIINCVPETHNTFICLNAPMNMDKVVSRLSVNNNKIKFDLGSSLFD